MKNSLFLSGLLSLFFYTFGIAQSDNKTKILGCWEVRQVIFSKEVEGSDEISMDAIGTVVCFEKDGKFINKKSEVLTKGSYSLSENGRTLYQNSKADSNVPAHHIVEDIPGQIIMLSDTELQIQAEEMILYFRRGE